MYTMLLTSGPHHPFSIMNNEWTRQCTAALRDGNVIRAIPPLLTKQNIDNARGGGTNTIKERGKLKIGRPSSLMYGLCGLNQLFLFHNAADLFGSASCWRKKWNSSDKKRREHTQTIHTALRNIEIWKWKYAFYYFPPGCELRHLDNGSLSCRMRVYVLFLQARRVLLLLYYNRWAGRRMKRLISHNTSRAAGEANIEFEPLINLLSNHTPY